MNKNYPSMAVEVIIIPRGVASPACICIACIFAGNPPSPQEKRKRKEISCD